MNTTNELKKKSFWERPEGTTGMFAIGAGVLALALSADFLISLFGKMITIMGQAITLGILGAVAFAIIMILSNSKFQLLCSYGFKSVMRAVTGWFVEIDPIGIMRNYISESKKKREAMSDSIAKLRGQIRLCEKNIKDNETSYNASIMQFKVAKEQQKTAAATLAGRQMERMEKMNKEYLIPIQSQMTNHLRALNKYYEATEIIILDMEQEVDAQQKLREMMKASHNAMSLAKKIMQGGEERELYDMALESSVADFGMKLGEIENFMENSRGFIESLDIQNGVADSKAIERLREWESNSESAVLGNQKRQMLEHQPTSGYVSPTPIAVNYDDLIGTKSEVVRTYNDK